MATATDARTRVMTEVEVVTPAMARNWLETMGPNRRLNEANVARLTGDMQSGNWYDNGDPIRFDRKGRLRDGQHRLEAVVRADRPQSFHVIRDLDEKALQIVDTGKQRTFADVLAMREGARAVPAALASKISSAAKWIWHYEHGTILRSGQAVSHGELDAVLRRHPDLPKRVEEVALGVVQPHAVLAFVYTLGAERAPRKARQWLTQVQEGEGLRRGMPAYELRDLLVTQRASPGRRPVRPVVLAALITLSLNAFLRGDRTVQLEWRRTKRTADEPFPVIGE